MSFRTPVESELEQLWERLPDEDKRLLGGLDEVRALWHRHPDRIAVARMGPARGYGLLLPWRGQAAILQMRALRTLGDEKELIGHLKDCGARQVPCVLSPLVTTGAADLFLDVGMEPLQHLLTYAKADRRLSNLESSHLEELAPGDRAAITALDADCFPRFWRLTQAELAECFEGVIVGVVEAGRLVGYAAGAVVGGRLYRQATIGRLAVHPEFRGRGIGGSLLAGTLERLWAAGARQVNLLTQVANQTSRRLYERLGFEVASELVLLGSPGLEEESWGLAEPTAGQCEDSA